MSALPATSRALVLEKARRLAPREFPLPEIGSEDGLLRVEACGLCGTDHEQYSGVMPMPTGWGVVPGHETVGVIEKLGSKAAQRWGVREGDRVAVEVFLSCRECKNCRAGNYRHCEKHGITEMYGFINSTRKPSLWGGYAQYHYLHPDSMLLEIPRDLDPVLATLFNPLGAGVRWGAALPQTKEGDTLAILGPGIRGLAALVAAKEAGAGFVMVSGWGEQDTGRLETARRFGADLTVDSKVTNPTGALQKETKRLADIVVDVTAKAPAALAQAIQLVRPGGTIVIAGTRGSGETPGFWPDLIVYKEIRILGALGVDVTAYRRAVEILSSGKYPFAEIPRRTAGFEDLETLIQTMAGEGEGPPPLHGVFVP